MDDLKDKENQELYEAGFNEALAEDEMSSDEVAGKAMYSDHVNALSQYLYNQFDYEKGVRYNTERRWVRDLRQYRGVYDPELSSRFHKNRSKAFIRLTRTKVKTIDARLMDLLFPANGEKNWSIEPTPIPELDNEVVQNAALQIFQQTGQVATPEQIQTLMMEEAKTRAGKMSKQMEDQLSETNYRSTVREVIHSGNLYGTGVLKGPFVREKVSRRWGKFGVDWAIVEMKELIPTCSSVQVWDCFPDMSAKKQEDMRYCFQRHIMGKHQMLQLSKRDDFNGDAIRGWVKAHPEGSAKYEWYEQDLREMSSPSVVGEGEQSHDKMGGLRKKYEVIEFWGYVDKETLEEAGIPVPEDYDDEVGVNAWFCDNVLIKAVITPLEFLTIPYYFYYFDKDETSIFGDGIPYLMRDPQALVNASVRAMLDNAAISAGPIIEANIELLAKGEDPNDVYPFRVFQRRGRGSDAATSAFRVNQMKSFTTEFMGMVNYFQQAADEVTTIPRYMYGETSNVSGAGQTASGLSMLMGSANITLKDQLKIFDDNITKLFIKNVYFWNMEFNPKEDIKGDFDIIARGSTSLVAKEVKLESLTNFLQAASNPMFQDYVNYDQLLIELTKLWDLENNRLVKSPEEVKQLQAARAQQEEQRYQDAKDLELLKAQSSGHVPGAAIPAAQELQGGNDGQQAV